MRQFNALAAAFSFCALLVVSYFSIGKTFGITEGSKRLTASLFESVPTQQVVIKKKDVAVTLSPDDIIAQAAYVFDPERNQVLFEKNADKQLPLASLTKLMTATVVLEHAPETDVVTISPEALTREGEYSLLAGEEWNVADLVSFMLITSSNDAAQALAEHVGHVGYPYLSVPDARARAISMMNERAHELRLDDSRFDDETGLDIDPETPSAIGSASDMAHLVAYIIEHHPALFDSTRDVHETFTSLSGMHHTAKNTNIAVPEIPGLIGGKTGFTDLAGGNLLVVFERDIGNPVIVVVLGSTKEGRFTDVVLLVNNVIGQQQQ